MSKLAARDIISVANILPVGQCGCHVLPTLLSSGQIGSWF